MWPARVLDAANHLRGCGKETSAVAHEEYGTKVVGFLHDGVVTIEFGVDVAILRHQLPCSAGSSHQRVAVVERTNVGPIVVTAGGFLVLELDVVEVFLLTVETVDSYWQIVALSIVGGIGVHHPFVMGHGDVDGTGCMQVVNVETHHVFGA